MVKIELYDLEIKASEDGDGRSLQGTPEQIERRITKLRNRLDSLQSQLS